MKIELNAGAESAAWAIAVVLIVMSMATCSILGGLG